MDASCFDEGALGVGDEIFHMRAKPQGEHLRNNLSNCMDEANGPIVSDPLRTIFLGQEHIISGVEPMEVVHMQIGEIIDHKHNLCLNDVPTFFEENARESVRARSFVSWKLMYCSTDLLLAEWQSKV